MSKTLKISLNIFFGLLVSVSCFGQKPRPQAQVGYLEFEGATRKKGVGLAATNIWVVSSSGDSIHFVSGTGGKFLLKLGLYKDYSLIFAKEGYASRTVLINGTLPESEKGIIYSNKFNIEMIELTENIPAYFLEKPVAKIRYDATLEDPDFDFDKEYSAKLRDELADIREKLKPKPNADSLANVLAQKVIADSVYRSLTAAQKKAMDDSISKAKADAKVKAGLEAKAKQDSVSRAQARAIVRQDSISKAEEDRRARITAAKLAEEEKIAAKQKADSLATVTAAFAVKARMDSIAIAEDEAGKRPNMAAAQRPKTDAANQKVAASGAVAGGAGTETGTITMGVGAAPGKMAMAGTGGGAETKTEVLNPKTESEAKSSTKKDSASLTDKKISEAEKKRLAEIDAQKKSGESANQSVDKKSAGYIPQIEKEYPIGVTYETIKEARRTIDRTVVNREDGVKYLLSKVTTDWGGEFWFKNEASISGATYDQEMKQAKALEKKAGGK